MIELKQESTKKVTALLPMKGHSERVPNKNMRSFAGKPLYYHVANTLQRSSYVSSIVINTDSEIIARDAANCFDKVKIIERPPGICGDEVPMNDIIAHDLSVMEGENYLQTHSTNPLLTLETLNKAIEEYFGLICQFDSLFSVTKIQTRLYWENGKPVNHNPEELLRTQDLPPLFEENSNIYLFSKDSFKKAGRKRIGFKPKLFVMDALEALDIDNEEDFLLAETIYKMRTNQNKPV